MHIKYIHKYAFKTFILSKIVFLKSKLNTYSNCHFREDANFKCEISHCKNCNIGQDIYSPLNSILIFDIEFQIEYKPFKYFTFSKKIFEQGLMYQNLMEKYG